MTPSHLEEIRKAVKEASGRGADRYRAEELLEYVDELLIGAQECQGMEEEIFHLKRNTKTLENTFIILRTAIESLQKKNVEFRDLIKVRGNAVEYLQKQNDKFRKALEFYADGKHFDAMDYYMSVTDDGGIAREALE